MDNVRRLPDARTRAEDAEAAAQADALAPASGAPRPLTVRRVNPAGPDSYFAPVIRLQPRRPDPTEADRPSGPGAVSPPVRLHQKADPEAAAELRQVTATARSVAQACLEAVAGTRPVQQLARWLDPASYEKLAHRADIVKAHQAKLRSGGGVPLRLHRSAVVRSARVCRAAEGAYEASLVVVDARRVRAIALRLELVRGLWKVTALEIG
ncbi:Rv3235 family protein [Arthrobacter sulfonylureivorans]|uniref:Rv3235 family protein n=1 Tax=Arthrobacter sulfonylureivorans TaxID=2486855 RepID=A0ABY3WER7_9MICC|nr:Rv3235 family protein [Arthrobacter sulfonylureivorans]UNK47063.1 Rv3235 family protein [Arthrobacter sulfonylureivorans]